MLEKRIRQLNEIPLQAGNVLYWMSEDQRVQDNSALLFAAELATKYQSCLYVAFCLQPVFLDASWRQYAFMLKGLQEVEQRLQKNNIPFYVLLGSPEYELLPFIEKHKITNLVCDFSSLRIKKQWKKAVTKQLNIPFFEVDAHNIIPCWLCSDKQEYAARTIRTKINKKLKDFLQLPIPFKFSNQNLPATYSAMNWNTLKQSLKIDFSVGEVGWLSPGANAAKSILKSFIETKLENYDKGRNNPNIDAQSHLSPYLHFGHISALRVAHEILRCSASEEAKACFLEELIIRRELAQNFCYYNENYDTTACFPDWATKTLSEHAGDKRDYIYSLNEFEKANTHDDLWNAAQRQMLETGKMHGYMRMYWAKKILEWTATPEDAMKIAIYLNDKYELDGRDPNGYAGIAWSIGGIHDRPWFERNIFGKIRYMNANGCAKKFDIESYCQNN